MYELHKNPKNFKRGYDLLTSLIYIIVSRENRLENMKVNFFIYCDA
jgi:hypothetical protein